ncbi:MAG: hypothetical protein M3388_16600 [Acidobacteriota bacterium]|nr:hypothetical protein [Acidobacteriota bacterium]
MNTEIIVRDEEEKQLFERVNKPNPKDADKTALQKRLAENPEIWQNAADLAKRTENNILDNCCSSSYLTKEIYREKLAALRDNLGWANSSEMEKILIEQVCLNWLRLNLLESVHSTKTTESHSFETGVYWDKRLSSAQRRYLRAVESLAKVRKLLTEAELKEEQARNKRSKSAAVANKFLNDSPR